MLIVCFTLIQKLTVFKLLTVNVLTNVPKCLILRKPGTNVWIIYLKCSVKCQKMNLSLLFIISFNLLSCTTVTGHRVHIRNTT